MSIIVWDGKTLALDNQSVSGEMRIPSRKVQRLSSGTVVAWTGTHLQGLRLLEWFKGGAQPGCYPTASASDDWCRLIVMREGKVLEYEGPYPEEVTLPFMAWGSGRDFAMGALAMGASAIQAVDIANKFCITCGYGVTAFSAQGEPYGDKNENADEREGYADERETAHEGDAPDERRQEERILKKTDHAN